MDDASLDRLLTGDLGRLPPLPKRVVRLFISSTFTDMTLERNSLMERVYPRLKKYCRERHGLDFQVVDMRWGVRDEATDDHQTVNLCSREIDNCQRVSLGPNFVALIGDKYGFRPLLNRIRSTEYRSLRRCLIESDINTDFLDTWYKEDLNAVPAEYLLQPISSILKNFTNKAEPELQMVDQKIWQAIQERLHDLLLIGSGRLVRQGRMSERERTLKYSISVTEREVLEGCLELKETKSHCLVYVRSIVDLRDQLARYFDDLGKLASSDDTTAATATITGAGKQPRQLEAPGSSNGSVASGVSDGTGSRRDSASRKASLKIGEDTISLATSGAQTSAERKLERQRRLIGKFIDLTAKDGGAWQIDEDAQEALGQLKEVKLAEKLGRDRANLTVYEVHWNDQDGISAKSEEHKQYLNDLTEHFYHNLTRMIRNAVRGERKVKTSGLVGEVLQHSHHSLQVAAKVHGRSGELEQIRVYIQTGRCEPRPSSLSMLASGRRQAIVLPMFLYGVSGSGKTSVLARVATLVGEWIKQATLYRRRSSTGGKEEISAPDRWDRVPCIITRFCCTTPASCSIVGMLTSVCRQLQYNFYQYGPLNGLLDKHQQQQQQHTNQLPYERIPEDFVRLVHTFRQLLNNCRHPLHKRRAFVIIIDSVERLLAPAECSLEAKYSWLTSLTRLPANVRLIVSCGSSSTSPANARTHDDDDDDYLHLKRHFLRAHYKVHEDTDAAESASSDLDSDADPSSASESATEKSSELVRVATHDGDRTQQLAAAKSSTRARYQLLRRLVLPVTRLARGSTSFTFEEGQAIAKEAGGGGQTRRSPVMVQFGPTTTTTTNEGKNDGPAGELETRTRSSLTLESSPSDTDSHNSATTRHSGRPNRTFGRAGAFTGAGLLHIRPLGPHLGQTVLRHWLAEAGRNLSQQQWSIVEKSLAGCSRPIFVKLAFGEVINWKSYSMQGDTKGLTFGSAWLADFSPAGQAEHSLCPELEKLCRATAWDGNNNNADKDDPQRARLKWQLLSMEQQWLNYLDYRSRMAEAQKNEGHNSMTTNGGDLVIRVGGQTGAHSRGPTTRTKSGASSLVLSVAGSAGNGGGGGGGSGPSSSLSICHLSDTIEDAICQLFARIELQHGYLLTKHSLSYITAARNGICENELEDILSLDDVVLDDVFQYHLPPVRRIPPLLWTRIRNDLPDYLSERDSDGIVIAWHHDQFKAVTERRYLADDAQLVYIHSLLADYFIGKWADKAKPFRCTRQQVQMAAEQLESAVQQSMRRDSDQPAGKRGSRSSLTGRLGSGSAVGGGGGLGGGHVRTGTSFSVRNRLRSSDQHDQRLQWMQAKALRRVPHQPIYYESAQGSPIVTTTTTTTTTTLADTPSQVKKTTTSGNRGQEEEGAGAGVRVEEHPGSGGPVKRRYNLRKLTELPYHLMRSARFLDLARLVLFNYRWLFASIDALGLQSLFCDLDEARHYLELELARCEPISADSNIDDEGEDKLTDLARQQPETQVPTSTGATTAQDQAAELAVATRDNLSPATLESLIKQVTMLSDTLRLSSSAIHSQPQMLAAQLIGRLTPAIREVGAATSDKLQHEDTGGALNGLTQPADTNSRFRLRPKMEETEGELAASGGGGGFLGKLLEQCYREGASDCALLPMGHCLCTADGLKLSSLEGQPFGVTAMALASDKRHLLAVSSKFIMWNISTGEIARDIEPGLSGALIRGLVMCANNQFALAYSSDSLVLALEILTQQVVRLDLSSGRRRCDDETSVVHSSEEDQIAGLELIDQREARRFYVWTHTGRLVIMRLEDVVSQQGGGGGASGINQDQPLSESEFRISIEYQIDQVMSLLSDSEDNQNKWRLLEVAVSQVEPGKTDLIFLTIADESCELTQVRLETLEVSLNSRREPERVEPWEPSDQASSLALSRPSMSQLVLADSRGNVCLRRRRATKWSESKLLARASSAGREALAGPLAIELESMQQGPETSSASDNYQIGDQLELKRLAEFEAKIDGDCDEIRRVSRTAFGRRPSIGDSNPPQAKRAAAGNARLRSTLSDQINFVKLYLSNCIVIIRLDSRIETTASSSSSSSYQQKCLMLPRDIRNVCLEPNKSQLMSKIILGQQPPDEHPAGSFGSRGHYYLAVAANRKLLIYSIESEQLLKCYDAHSKRITSLLTISQGPAADDRTEQVVEVDSTISGAADQVVGMNMKTTKSSATKSASTQQFSNALATCSLDRTVNIWNLQNINKEERQIDRIGQSLRSTSSTSTASLQFDSVQVNSQLPLAACLCRGQLSIWDWPRSRLVLEFGSIDDLLAAVGEQQLAARQKAETSRRDSTFTSCKFSPTGRYLALASTAPNAVHLLACEGPQLASEDSEHMSPSGRRRGDHQPSRDKPIGLKKLAQILLEGPIRSMDFFARDSRLLLATECPPPPTAKADIDQVANDPDELASTTIGTSTTMDEEDEDEDDEDERVARERLELFDRILVSCLTVPEMRPVYSFESLVPRRSGESMRSSHTRVNGHTKRLRDKMTIKAISGQQVSAPTTGFTGKNRMVGLTSDQQLVVVVEAKSIDGQGQSCLSSDKRKLLALRRRSSALSRPQIALNLYASRDGKFVTSIDLSQLQTLDQQQQQPVNSPQPPVRINKCERTMPTLNGLTISGVHMLIDRRPPPNVGSQHIAIKSNQFNRLKAIRNRERQSLVALIDDQQGTSFIIDINSRLLITRSSIWAPGKLTSDGRYGLSRMSSCRAPTIRAGLAMQGVSHAVDEFGSTASAIRLLEMRHCQPLKSLLTLDQLSALNKSSSTNGLSSGTAGHYHGPETTLCGFTKPNDAYVYFCDLRQRRLLLLRTRDSQLIANYKLSTPISHLKCSGDGYALLLAQTDGSLIPLAIVDPQSSEAQTRLQSHLARRQQRQQHRPPN